MNAYSYDENGVFVRECICQRDPVRSAREGKDCFLIPANATTVEPPSFDAETQVCTWDGEVWTVTDKPIPEPIPESEPQPSAFDLLEAQVTYTAMMTDTLLEG